MEPLTAIVQAICLFFGYMSDQDKFMNECMKTHTKVECQQLWRDKK
jgi:7,8-dihydro-6-hydroxymethylpterin-pyrophosphokinase